MSSCRRCASRWLGSRSSRRSFSTSPLDAGHLDLQREVVSLDEVAQTARRGVCGGGPVRRPPLDVSSADDAARLGDEQRMLQITRVLVENALLHTPSRRRACTSRLQERSRAARGADDGPGIDASQATHVFDRFYRVDGTRRRAAVSALRSPGSSRG